jgi:HAD superfamily hydrolase (TIGR01484 family)
MLIVSDLDGTLLSKETPLSEMNRKSFERARRMGGVCAIATGRSLLGVEEELEPGFPIDYLIFSSGAGIYDWQDKKLLHHRSLNSNQVVEVHEYLQQLSREVTLDFTIQLEAPDTHQFFFTPVNPANSDFTARLSYHQNHGSPLEAKKLPLSASEFIIIQPPTLGSKVFERIKGDLGKSFNVVRATSPIDTQSIWIEIFHPEVSKGHAADWVRRRHGLSQDHTCALGNDYNDLQLLSWAKNPLVVGDAAPELLKQFESVANHSDSALAHALEIWLEKIKR